MTVGLEKNFPMTKRLTLPILAMFLHLGVLASARAAPGEGSGPPLHFSGPFETRYVLHRGIGPEELAKNWRPAWDVKATPDGTGFEISGDVKGNAIGTVYYGAPLTVARPIPRTVRLSFEFQAFCVSDNRVPVLSVSVFTPEGWAKLGAKPEADVPWDRLSGGGKVASQDINKVMADDILEWTRARSQNLTSALRAARGDRVVVAVGVTTFHAYGEEWAKVRNVRLEASDAPPEPIKREQKWPLKETRTLHTDEDVARARRNCETYESARAVRDGIVAACQQWLSLSDAEVLRRIPGADVPRAGNVSVHGCPVHGKEVYAGGSCYPWKLDFDRPFTITCPVGGERYPSNDFFGTYAGPKKRFGEELRQQYADDGWGWVAPSGERYWLVGYACHWWWYRLILRGVLDLSRSYVLTGEARYAHVAALMLDRIASVYPEMDYENQSRYGQLTPHNYSGKILNRIWETFTLRQLAEAYDNIFPAIDQDVELQRFLGKTGKQIRANIETNLLQEGIDCVPSHHIRGNFGMHQAALLTASVVRQRSPVAEHIKWLMTNTEGSESHEGMEYALYNFVYRDGMPFETSPGYCFLWVRKFAEVAEVLRGAGVDFYANRKFKKMLDAPLDMICAGTQTPAEGDSGTWHGGAQRVDFNVYLPALREYRSSRYAAWLNREPLEGGGFMKYELLFGDPLARLIRKTLPPRREPAVSRIMPGYGMAILNNAADSLAAAVYYGYRGGHGHFDSLNLHLLDSKGPLMPDPGYPDFMNSYVPGIFSWSQTTIAHNTVTVDRRRQFGNARGTVREFVSDGVVHLTTIDNPAVYPEITQRYMRTVLFVSTGERSGYVVDIFRVIGGEQHDYSLHGGPGEFAVLSGDFTPAQAKGTLAGPEVEIGEIYDDPVLGAKDYRGGYSSYKGSGFQHLLNVQRQTGDGAIAVEWRPRHPDTSRRLRLHLTGQPDQRAILADAQVSPVKRKELLKYVIARRQGRELASTYAAVIEPYPSERAPEITRASRIDVGSEEAVALRIDRREGSDIVCHALSRGADVSLPGGAVLNGRFCFYHLDARGRVGNARVLDGVLRIKERSVASSRPVTGRVVGVDPLKEVFVAKLDQEAADLSALAGRTLLVVNDAATFPYRITSAQASAQSVALHVAGQEIRSGCCKYKGYDAERHTVKVHNHLRLAPVYAGVTLTDESFRHFFPVAEATRNACRIAPASADPTKSLNDSDGDGVVNFWLLDGGPGDRIRIDVLGHE